MLDRLASPRGGYHTTSKAGAKRQAPQAKAQVSPSFQGGLNPNGQDHNAKTKPATSNRGRGRGAGKSGRGGHWLPHNAQLWRQWGRHPAGL